jgi:hypothetical protein
VENNIIVLLKIEKSLERMLFSKWCIHATGIRIGCFAAYKYFLWALGKRTAAMFNNLLGDFTKVL